MNSGWAKTQLLYMLLEVVALKGPSDLGTHARAFQLLRHKPVYVLSPFPLFGMFLITLEQRFLYFSTRCSA